MPLASLLSSTEYRRILRNRKSNSLGKCPEMAHMFQMCCMWVYFNGVACMLLSFWVDESWLAMVFVVLLGLKCQVFNAQ